MAKVPPSNNFLTVKRGPSAPLSGSSSESENSDLEEVPPSPSSSTSSGPIYVRPAGFKHHAQEVQASLPRTSNSIKLKKRIRKNAVVKDILLQEEGINVDKNNNNNNNLASVPPVKTKQKAKKGKV